MSSVLSRFMHSARAILERHDQMRLAPEQPPVFVRAHWLFVEIDEALAKSMELSKQIKVARIQNDVAGVARLNIDLQNKLRQAAQLSSWAEDQFKREGV